jgi:hypothetical protein
MGVARFATLSDGTFYAPLGSFKRHESLLRRAQQAMSRKTKFSNNWRKAKHRVQRIHARIGNARRDFLHKIGGAAGWLPCRRRTRAAPVRAAAMCRRTTGKRKPGSRASNAVSRKTPMWSARSTSFLAGCKCCETKGRTRRTLAPGAKAQPGSPVK